MGEEVDRRIPRLSARGSVRLLAATVFLGYILLWMISPTNRYKQKWLPKLRADTASSFFGSQGTNILVYTFPVLFVAILGCLYAHLKKSAKCYPYRVGFWKRPAVARGPLGIVSRAELAFLALFIAHLVYYFSVYLSASFSRITPQSAAKKGEKLWEAKMESAGHRMGLLGSLCLAFLFFPVTRGSSILPLAGLTSESSIKYHIWLGNITMVILFLHGFLYFIYWASTDSLSSMGEWAEAEVSNLAGVVALVIGLVLWAATLPWVRRKMFEVFFYAHQLYALFLLFFLLHVGMSFFFIVLPGIYLFMIDRFLRFLQSRGRVPLVSARLLPGDTVELNFAKSPARPPGMVFVNVPAVSKLQWHPFTVASNSNLQPDTLSVVIKKEGSWTQKLHRILSSTSPDRLEVALEGPYGPLSNSFSSFDSLVLISGGSGITPFISIIREFIFRSNQGDSATPNIHLISSFKTSADLTMLHLLLPSSSPPSDLSRLNLRVDAFVTREEAPTVKENPMRTLLFKPKSTDEPISAVLGPHSWLTLAAIIASFGIFLVLIGIMNSHYKNKSYAAKALLSLLIICGAAAGGAAVAFLWSKQRSAVDATTGPAATGAELESVPRESLALSTSVHYGVRPDLKKILLELKEERVGVMVSGPKEMRRHVAEICSSGLANNLHYEAMSFSW